MLPPTPAAPAPQYQAHRALAFLAFLALLAYCLPAWSAPSAAPCAHLAAVGELYAASPSSPLQQLQLQQHLQPQQQQQQPPQHQQQQHAQAEPLYIVSSWCLGGSAEGPALASLKSLLMADLQHGDWSEPSTAAPLVFVLIVDLATRAAWANDAAFQEVRTLVQRHPLRYSVRFIVFDQVAALVSAAVVEEAGAAAAAALDVGAEALNMFRPCSGVRLFVPLLLAALTPRFLYLDYDTVTLCDVRRLAAAFSAFAPRAALGLAREDPTGALWDGWYTRLGLPTAVPGGVNAGVLLVDSAALAREFGGLAPYLRAVLGIVRGRGYQVLVNATSDYAMDLGDQDVLNVLLVQRPHLLHVLPAAWNVMAPGARQWRDAPAYQPPAPCLLHYNNYQWRYGAGATTMGNSAYLAVQEWRLVNEGAPPPPPPPPPPPLPGAAAGTRAALAALHAQLDALGLGRVMGHTADLPQHATALHALLQRALPPAPPGGLVLCELGFNVGHGAATFLAAAAAAGARVAQYVAFELPGDDAVAAGAAAVAAAFPATALQVHYGDAGLAFPAWLAGAPGRGPCDLVHVDASHSHGAPARDIGAALAAARADGQTLVLVNDCGCLPGSGAWCDAPEAAFLSAAAAGGLVPLAEGARVSFVSKGTCAARGVRPAAVAGGGA